MILLLDTATPLCRLTLVDGDEQISYEWQADRQLARLLHGYIRDRLADQGAQFTSITGIGVMKGPGSFTGLRIGVTVCNTLADALQIPIVGEEMADDWYSRAVERLKHGDNDRIILPYYGREATITQPRK